MYLNNDSQYSRQTHVFIAILKLVIGASILYGMCIVIPQAVQLIEGLQQQEAEQLKVRVIANSSSAYDQQIKQQVVEEIQAVVNNTVHAQDEEFFEQVMHNVQQKFPREEISLRVGDNLLPPKYQFAHFYPQNHYYSAVFVIGQGRGDNWFCAAFPTVCRRSQEEAQEPSAFFFSEWLIGKQ